MAFDKAKALQEAHKLVAQGKILRAIRQYELITEKDPGDLTLLNLIGDLYAQENNTGEALKYFYKLADAYTREGYKVKAIAIYKKISKIDRSKPEPLLRLAELQSSQGFTYEAREQYRNAFEFFDGAGQKDKALEILRKLCQLDPKNPDLHLDLAQFAERSGERSQAAAAYLDAAVLAEERGDCTAIDRALNKAAELAPENPEVHLLRARRALADNRPEEVSAILDSAPESQSNPQARRILLDSYLATNDLGAARRLLLDVFQSDPADFAPVADFAARCIKQHLPDEALEVLKAVTPELIARRDTGELMDTLSSLWRASPGHVDILKYAYEVAEKIADEAAIPEVLEALGDAYFQLGQFEKAEQACAWLVARRPENETYKELLRQVLEKQGKEYVLLIQTPLISPGVGLESGPDMAQVAGRAGPGLPPALQETGILQLKAGAELPPRPVEIDLSGAAYGQPFAEDEPELPPPQEISLSFQTVQPSESTGNGAGALGSIDSGVIAQATQEPQTRAPATAPPFDYEESREEIEFYLRHGFFDEAQKAVADLEAKYPGEERVAEFRQRVDELTRKSRPPGKDQPAVVTASAETKEPELELPTSFSGILAPGNRDESVDDLASELSSALGDIQCAPAAPAAPAAQPTPDADPRTAADLSAELGSLLDELGDDSESVDQPADDDETHYNLGVAFREMGLLDEAIGEFQKVVNGTGLKHSGSYTLQGCTLLASCFMEKEMPAIAAKWYLRALDAPGLDHQGALALYYDLGMAFEKAGDTSAALEKFTEVYSQNIDYRDVAEKIRYLRRASR